MGFFVFGVNHKECPVAIREKLHFTASMTELALQDFAQSDAVAESLILSTCNRVEFYGFGENISAAQESFIALIEKNQKITKEEFAPFLYRYEGKQAIAHLFRVASGLDSLVIGENEILGQLREAFKLANQTKSVQALLYRLTEKALKIGKEVRTKTKINEGAVSIPAVAVELAEKIFGRLSGQKVMVIGTGEMSTLTIQNLQDSGAEVVYVVSRSKERGEKVALQFGAQWIALESWPEYMKKIDILIASTNAPHPIVHFDQIKKVLEARHHKPLFLIDIAVPRNIEPSIDAMDDVYLYNIDDLKGVSAANLRLRHREIRAAEQMVEEAVIHFQSWVEQLAARPVLERYENFLAELLDTEFSALAGEAGWDPQKQEKIKSRLLSKLLHPPTEKIKEASKNGGVTRYVEALHALFHLDAGDQKRKNEDPSKHF